MHDRYLRELLRKASKTTNLNIIINQKLINEKRLLLTLKRKLYENQRQIKSH